MRLRAQWGSGTPVPADAKFRGVSSFRDCKSRKSLTLNMEGPRGRRLMRGVAANKVFLIR